MENTVSMKTRQKEAESGFRTFLMEINRQGPEGFLYATAGRDPGLVLWLMLAGPYLCACFGDGCISRQNTGIKSKKPDNRLLLI
jgi:hypothetical protein